MAREDLKPNILTHADKIKGGKSRSILKSLVKREYCDPGCRLFKQCPFASMGLKYKTCYLNCKQYPTLRRIVNKILSGNEQDFLDAVDIIVSDMHRIVITEDDGNINTKKKVVEAMKMLYDMRFGSKQRVEHTGKVDIELFKKYLETE